MERGFRREWASAAASGGRADWPGVAAARQEQIDAAARQRARGERPEQAIRAEEAELHVPRAIGDERGKEDAPEPAVRRGLRIGDHEEREEQQRAALQPVQRDGHRLAQPERAPEDQREIGAEKGERHIAPRGAIHHQPAEAGHEKAEERRVSPLAGRDPHLAVGREHQRDEAEVRRVEEMLAAQAQAELAGDREEGRRRREPGRIRAEQQAKRKPGDQRAAGIELRQPPPPGARPLRAERHAEEQRHARRRHAKLEPGQPVQEQPGEGGDLEEARVGSHGCAERYENPSRNLRLPSRNFPSGLICVPLCNLRT